MLRPPTQTRTPAGVEVNCTPTQCLQGELMGGGAAAVVTMSHHIFKAGISEDAAGLKVHMKKEK